MWAWCLSNILKVSKYFTVGYCVYKKEQKKGLRIAVLDGGIVKESNLPRQLLTSHL